MPEFSIVIPTRNRPLSAQLAIKSALAEAGDDAEVIVSDNSDQPIDLDPSDSRVRHLRSDAILSMPDNWEQGVRAAKGNWIILISDKCRLVPGALRALRALAGTDYQVVTYFRTTFIQELSPQQLDREIEWTSSPGRLVKPMLPLSSTLGDSVTSLRSWFRDVAYTGKHPMLYNALVQRSVLERTVKKYRALFLGMAPDVSSSVSILSETDKYLETNLPATIIHFPTTRLMDWSNGHAFRGGNKLDKTFTTEFGSNPLGRYRLPNLGMAVVLQTLLETYRQRRESLPDDLTIGWDSFARSATYAIEKYYPKDQRARLHRQVLESVHLNGIKPAALLAQLKALGHVYLPALHKLRQKITLRRDENPAEQGSQAQALVECSARSLDDALSTLANDVRTLDVQRPMTIW